MLEKREPRIPGLSSFLVRVKQRRSDMKQATPFSLDQLASKAMITIEQTGQVLGLGRNRRL